ncbi:DEAD/DEAH box helicase [Paenibacillus sp. sptzw28]|uniref:DEAD/DEAH box helicase n=1 Tax=Paenibacillus sp. sptzw28 TaxID=715179 RepID=UPI001C6EEE56|nr:DEAD/DEAH box helicase [Paenibacillus sp. sptzw28]QYR20207.1 DEAD/DEAH box helicase [Paenibacillus sp. sptzw28]
MNNFPLTLQDIEQLCGAVSYKRGQEYYRDRKVTRITYDEGKYGYRAVVQSGGRPCEVRVEIDSAGGLEAECDCPAFGTFYSSYCKHVAAVLMHVRHLELQGQIMRKQPIGSGISPQDLQLGERMLSLFGGFAGGMLSGVSGSRESSKERKELKAEYICEFVTGSFAERPGIRLEMRLGDKRTFVVSQIAQLLESIERGDAVAISRHFTYDPLIHCFNTMDRAVIDLLIHAARHEREYREMAGTSLFGKKTSAARERYIQVTPMTWELLYPVLLKAGAVMSVQGRQAPLGLEEGELPVMFQLHEHMGDTYQLEVQGLSDLKIMETYGCAVHDGIVYKVERVHLDKLARLKELLASMPEQRPVIAAGRLAPFMEQVMPGLTGMGRVRVAPTIRNRIVQSKLKAKVYADWDEPGNKLLLKVEFVYDTFVVNPYIPSLGEEERSTVVLVREQDKEQRILKLLEQGGSVYGGDGLFVEHEEAIFDFLFHTLPELERLAEVYVTSSVKALAGPANAAPKISADMDSDMNWLEIKFDIAGIDKKEIRSLLLAIMEKKRFYRLPGGAFVDLEGEALRGMQGMFQQLDIRHSEVKDGAVKLPLYRGFQMLDENAGPLGRLKMGRSLRQLLDNMRNPDNLEFPVPQQLASVLRDYQAYGYQWMKMLAHYRFGGILADDMGLGKTLQSIAFILSEKSGEGAETERAAEKLAGRNRVALVVCPASLLYNWENEFHRFAPELKVVVAAGERKDRFERLESLSRLLPDEGTWNGLADSPSEAGEADVIITSYPLLRRDAEWYQSQVFHTLILDEAQFIKNHMTQTALAVKKINAERRFALTGTPVENSMEELWSIFDAVFPGLFADKKTFRDMPGDKVARLVRPFILRRLKADVLKELPDKIETVHRSELQTEQKKLYAAYLERLQKDTLRELEKEGFQKSRIKILAGITRLRQLCCHPSLFVENYEGSSGKLEQLMELAQEALGSGRRMLIFSQFTGMLAVIRRELSRSGISAFYLDGSTPSAERMDMSRRFNEGEHQLFLISLKAGGTGLNLTGADTVILYDLWWNPAVEQQAADRAHRIGQKKVVQVHRLVAKGTVEEKMLELQQRKKDLIDQVIQPDMASGAALTEQDIRDLLGMG